jgi:hypothetical protein
MNRKQKQQPTIGETLRKNPTIDSALPSGSVRSHPHGGNSRSFKAGDSIIEKQLGDQLGGIMFGVVVKVDKNPEILDVVFPIGRLYSFASHCQHYQEWLDENL